jgi:hypothetical protein
VEILLEWLFGIPIIGGIIRVIFIVLSFGIGALLLLMLIASMFGSGGGGKDYGRPDR